MSVMMGQKVGRQAFTSAIGIQFREQVALALLTSLVINELKEDIGGQAAEGGMSSD